MEKPSSPFSFLDSLAQGVGGILQPPGWMVDEVQHRAVLFVNHVLQQEPEALARLARQKGRVALVRWRDVSVRLLVTPAGLLDRAPPAATPDLTLHVTDGSPMSLAQAMLRGQKPPVRIEGDVQFAAEINWLVDHVRWDVEDDLARVIGDTPAHLVAGTARRVTDALRQFVGRHAMPADPTVATAGSAASGAGGAGTAT